MPPVTHQLIIATRQSPLAMRQAHWVKTALQQAYPALSITLLGLKTQADKQLESPLATIGGKGLFVKELEEALLAGHAQIAVHSMKDVPMDLPAGLCLPVICQREDPRDVCLSRGNVTFADLVGGQRVGTGSLRRQTQLYAKRPDLAYGGLRGNLETRLARLETGQFDAIILASAGLKRMGLSDRISSIFSINDLLPAPGQGALGIECRIDDRDTQQLIAVLNDPLTATCVQAERAVCRRLGGGCHTPIAAFATVIQDQLFVRGLLATPHSTRILRALHSGSLDEAILLGNRVADTLLTLSTDSLT